MADGSNIYQEVKDAMATFKKFLDDNTPVLKPAIAALKPIVPQIGDLLTKLIDLMGQLKTAINNIDLSTIGGDALGKISAFTAAVTGLLKAAESLLPQQKDAIESVLGAASVVTGLPSLDTVKQDILNLIDGIIADLTQLNS